MKHLLTFAVLALTATSAFSQSSPKGTGYIEKLSRGVVAVPMERGNFVSWRSLATDPKALAFDLYRDGQLIAANLNGATCFVDTLGNAKSVYKVVSTLTDGIAKEGTSVMISSKDNAPFLSIPLRKPADGVDPDGGTYRYTPNDCSCADVDGDGEYEIILKWDPSNAHDNAHNGYTGNVLIDCYKISTDSLTNFLWRIDLGKNIRAGAHYTQFLVYDFDGDGKAEMICKTAPGSVDGKGKFVTEAATESGIKTADNSANYVEDNGRILSGPEYLTVFSGLDGHAIHTIYYNPNRAFGYSWDKNTKDAQGYKYDVKGWGDSDQNPGNRGERFLACVAYLGPVTKGSLSTGEGEGRGYSAVMCRGYYTCSNLWAVDFDGKELSTRWLHTSPSRSEWKVLDGKGKVLASAKGLGNTAFAQGAHSLSVGDVDGDGYDEITYGSAAIDHDGTLLYSTGLGHGDAQHLGDLDPDRPGLEYYMVHEENPHGSDLRDARTGEILFHETDTKDTGRGISADIDSLHRGSEFWCSAGKKVHDVKGNVICETEGWTPQNFRIYWDGDLYDELIGNGGKNMMPGGNPWGMQMPGGQNFKRGKRGQRGQRGSRPEMNGQMPQQGQMPQGMRPDMQNGQMPQGMRTDMRNGQMPPQGFANNDSIRKNFSPRGSRMLSTSEYVQKEGASYYIAKWNGKGVDNVKINGKDLSGWGHSASCNGTKATPCLQADLFGDWREELVLYDASDNAHLNIFSTNIPTKYRVPTLMHDHIYRMGVAWQNVTYNQPPHLGYYLPDSVK